jgi:transposase
MGCLTSAEAPRQATMNNTNETAVEPKIGLIKIAIDMHLASYRVVRQSDYSTPQPPQKFTPEKFYEWLRKQLGQAARVVVCYEAGCFGYEPARRMQKLGVEVLVIAPQDWDEQKTRQAHDKLDALVMCRRLSEYLSGHPKALAVVTIPTPEEEAARSQSRFREQLRRQIRRMQAMGRSLLLQREMVVRGRWWAGATWTKITQQMPVWVVQQLEIWKGWLEVAERDVRKVEAQLTAAAPAAELWMGEGRLSHEILRRELLQPTRFGNPRQVGNYFGLCPSESSSGPRQRRGAITKHGSPRLRRVLIEMAWRVVRYQPAYRGCVRWQSVFASKASPSARKKAIVALARQLAVDLWRIALGRVTPEALGLRRAGPTSPPVAGAPVHA